MERRVKQNIIKWKSLRDSLCKLPSQLYWRNAGKLLAVILQAFCIYITALLISFRTVICYIRESRDWMEYQLCVSLACEENVYIYHSGTLRATERLWSAIKTLHFVFLNPFLPNGNVEILALCCGIYNCQSLSHLFHNVPCPSLTASSDKKFHHKLEICSQNNKEK